MVWCGVWCEFSRVSVLCRSRFASVAGPSLVFSVLGPRPGTSGPLSCRPRERPQRRSSRPCALLLTSFLLRQSFSAASLAAPSAGPLDPALSAASTSASDLLLFAPGTPRHGAPSFLVFLWFLVVAPFIYLWFEVRLVRPPLWYVLSPEPSLWQACNGDVPINADLLKKKIDEKVPI